MNYDNLNEAELRNLLKSCAEQYLELQSRLFSIKAALDAKEAKRLDKCRERWDGTTGKELP